MSCILEKNFWFILNIQEKKAKVSPPRTSNYNNTWSDQLSYSIILRCDAYLKNFEKFAIENATNLTSPSKAKFFNFKDKFKTIKKVLGTTKTVKEPKLY